MRILALLTLSILTMASIPAFAMEYLPAATPLSGAESPKPRPISAKPGKRFRSIKTMHHRGGNRIRTIDGPSGLIITDYMPDGHRALASQDYLPHFSENLVYETDDYRNRFWRLKKVSPGSVVASVKYRF
jgi:hypothetical protein